MDLLDFIFPKKCVVCRKAGSYLCDACFSYLSFETKSLCLVCDRPSFDGFTHFRCHKKYTIDGCFSAISYNKTAKKLIYSFKYKPYVSDLRGLLSEFFYESIIQKEEFINLIEKDNWIIVAIPLSTLKLRKRGYNQAEILALELSKRLKIPQKDLLVRIKNTDSQFKLSKNERRENIKGAFRIKNQNLKTVNRNILLIDDVVTSGATLLEAANLLKRNGAKKVIGLTLARD